jgi:methyl-accepting chemotaxis protein/methyl-accepting chemotaxis protein-1 (serine sensor receptor)
VEDWQMSQWGIGRRLFVGIGALVALILVSGGIAIWAGSQMKQQLDRTARETARKLNLAQQIAQGAVTLDAEQRRLLLAGLGADQDGQALARRVIRETVQTSKKLLSEMEGLNSGDGRQLSDISASLEQWESSHVQVDQLIANGDASAAWDIARKTSGPLLERVRSSSASLVNDEEKAFAASVEEGDSKYSLMRLLLIGMLIVSATVAAFVAHVVRSVIGTLKNITSDLADGANQVASAAVEVAGAAQGLSQGSSRQAASLEETSAAMVEMTSISRKNAEASHTVADMATEANGLIKTASGALTEMVASMNAIKESSDKVAKIIKTIDEIAFQTNILALNAAVEAARAGEAGMGFAVVADEVRSLAQRSAQAARDTAALIDESIARASDGQRRVGQVADAVSAVSTSAARIKTLVEEVRASSREQIEGIDQVTHAVSDMEKVTQSTAAGAQENAAVGEELSAQAESTMAAIRRLSSLIEGGEGMAHDSTASRANKSRPARVIALPKGRAARGLPLDKSEEAPAEGTGTYGTF